MMRILFWLMGLMNDRATDTFTSPPPLTIWMEMVPLASKDERDVATGGNGAQGDPADRPVSSRHETNRLSPRHARSAEPAPQTSVCHLHGCEMPAHAGHVLCEGHLIADRIGYYDPTEGWGTE